MSSWSLTPIEWSQDSLSLLLECNLEHMKEFTIEDLVKNSEKHPVKFPVDTGRLKTLKNKDHISEIYLKKCINSAYVFVHEKVLKLIAEFIILKRNHGSSIEKKFYEKMNLKDFVDRLIKKRAVMFMGRNDKYMLITGERGANNWESIEAATLKAENFKRQIMSTYARIQKKTPLTLQNCLSYDEIKLSAFIFASSYTHFINKGDRKNKAIYCEDRSKIEKEGIIAGLIGPRLKKENVMDFQEMVISEKQNKECNGYGKTNSVHKLFASFYEEKSILFNELRRNEQSSSRYIDLKTPKGAVFDNQIYHKRLSIVFDCLLLEANFRAKEADKTAYVHVVGFGLGVWRISDHQESEFMKCFYDRIISLGQKLSSISDICFSYINQDSCGDCKNGETIPIGGHPANGIRIHIFNRQPHEKLMKENEGKLLVVSYAWDGNALPGNEFWDGKLGSSGDSAAASSTQITELHNPHISPLICADNLKIVTCYGELLNFSNYVEKRRSDANYDVGIPESDSKRMKT